MHLWTALLPHIEAKVTQAPQAKSTGVLGELWKFLQMSSFCFMACDIAPEKMPSEKQGDSQVWCCCSERLVSYWARNAPTDLCQRETVLHKRSSGGSCYCKLVPSITSNTQAAFQNALYFCLYTSKCDC